MKKGAREVANKKGYTAFVERDEDGTWVGKLKECEGVQAKLARWRFCGSASARRSPRRIACRRDRVRSKCQVVLHLGSTSSTRQWRDSPRPNETGGPHHRGGRGEDRRPYPRRAWGTGSERPTAEVHSRGGVAQSCLSRTA
jgi:hypothetical protein